MSYIRTNEAIALMNGMGYNVIEFNKPDTLIILFQLIL